MTWADVAAEGLKYKEMGIDRENVITVLQGVVEERVKCAEGEILEKTEKMAYDIFVKRIKKELEKELEKAR